MGSVFLAALALVRPRSILPSLTLSAAVMAGVDPKVLRQIYFQLSFTAFARIVLVLLYLSLIFEAMNLQADTSGTWQHLSWQVKNWILSAVVVSVGATFATLALVAMNFDHVLPATYLALPAMPFILVKP